MGADTLEQRRIIIYFSLGKKGRKRGFNSIYPIKTTENKQTKQTKNKQKQTKNKQKTNKTKQTINKQNKRKQQNNENKQNKQNKRTLTKPSDNRKRNRIFFL